MNEIAAFQRLALNPVKFRAFLLAKLPSAFFAGLRVEALTERECTVMVPFKWFTQNPFRSTYFACLAMAAELSTGALCMQFLWKRQPAVSMLVTGTEARFFRKATGKTYFTCADGPAIHTAIGRAIATGEGQTVVARSTGRNTAGETVAEFNFTWSFKAKS
ncbi:DUF4442 domain-containing protein [Flaviaesturariibacter flavus]|uniref:DUF4442 domain-containing protein n=1 Tax=Flaviaesturariibacter flavus TaxID=2502780 RepID=A0A4R1BMQ5_9BACT|nr:DUF4442 domain-containing protein [Flaviaesturariibacter flavus]TCJ18598.1 DUF4442 domain-containing protein [Flaviaesturariibacter flavus]